MSIDNHQLSSVATNASASARTKPPRSAFVFSLIVTLLVMNVGTIIYSAKNASELRNTTDNVAVLQRTVATLRGQLKQQTYVSDKIEALKEQTQLVRDDMTALEGRMRTRLFSFDGSLILSAPNKYAAQQLRRPLNQQASAISVASDDSSDAENSDLPVADLPQYERTISSEGKLILRKMR